MSRSSSTKVPSSDLEVYADGYCHTQEDGEFGGYGVYCPLYAIRISEPLPGSVQTLEKAHLASLQSALELIHGVRARNAVIYMNAGYLVEAYENQLQLWEANRWSTENGRVAKRRKGWKPIWRLWNGFLDRGVEVTVKLMERNGDHNLRLASRLARQAPSLHVTCELCLKTHGRQWVNHACEPICNLDDCRGRVMKDVMSYMKHMRRRHQKKSRRKNREAQFTTFDQDELGKHQRQQHGRRMSKSKHHESYFKSPRKAHRHERATRKETPHRADHRRSSRSRKEFAQYYRRRAMRSESSSESDEDELYVDDVDDDALDDEIGMDLARYDFGRYNYWMRGPGISRSKSMPSLGKGGELVDEDDFEDLGSESDGELSYSSRSSSGSEYRGSGRRHRGSYHGSSSKSGGRHRSRSGSRHRSRSESRHRSKSGGRRGRRHDSRHEERRPRHDKERDEDKHVRKSKVKLSSLGSDRDTVEFFLDEQDLRQQQELMAKQQVRREPMFVPQTYRYGANSE
eukprot:GFKZ01000320.1.p1 GENE.GFKZ01000320.1~~GFKZ01000320.1.p1  ORF type:complete len:513 (-),score=47.95 GFKZ01000320.1:643-2181(-)